jgi:hypothetical protein
MPMTIRTTIEVDDPSELAYTTEQAQVLAALGGNPTVDTSHVSVMKVEHASAGASAVGDFPSARES